MAAVEQLIQRAFPGDDPTTKGIRVSLIQLVHMAERVSWSLDGIKSQLRFVADSPLEAVLDGILIEEAELLAARHEALGMEIRVVARKLDALRKEWYGRAK